MKKAALAPIMAPIHTVTNPQVAPKMAAPSPVRRVPGTNRQTPTAYTATKRTGAQMPAAANSPVRASAVRKPFTGVKRTT